MKSTMLTAALTFVLAFSVSCANRNKGAVLVEPGSVLMVGPKTKGFVYYYREGAWHLSDSKVVIPEGWYAAPLGPNDP